MDSSEKYNQMSMKLAFMVKWLI